MPNLQVWFVSKYGFAAYEMLQKLRMQILSLIVHPKF
jgi:hypothetical protein